MTASKTTLWLTKICLPIPGFPTFSWNVSLTVKLDFWRPGVGTESCNSRGVGRSADHIELDVETERAVCTGSLKAFRIACCMGGHLKRVRNIGSKEGEKRSALKLWSNSEESTVPERQWSRDAQRHARAGVWLRADQIHSRAIVEPS